MTRQIEIILLLTLAMLSGCGEVTVFGHVVRDAQPKAEVKQASSSSSASSVTSQVTASSSSSSQSSTTHAISTPKATSAASAQPSTPAAPSKVAVADQPVRVSTIVHVESVTLSIKPEVAAQLSKDSRFNSNTLLDTIKAELQSRKLLGSDDSQSGATLLIYIDNYDLHATTNFVLFGATPHTGTLAGNLMLNNESGETTPIAHVETYSRISVPEGDAPRSLLQPLYHDFAVTVANSLASSETPVSSDTLR